MEILYHGSDHVVDPNPYYENPDNDFGKGFYLADDYQVSAEWACMFPKNAENIVNQYDFDRTGLRILDFMDGTHTIMEWIGTMLIHRKIYNLPTSLLSAFHFLRDQYGHWDLSNNYDVVISRRADDSYFNVSTTYLSNSCDIEGLKWCMSRGNMREQIVLVNPIAFTHLSNPQYYDVRENFRELNQAWRNRQDEAKRQVANIQVMNPERTLAMLMHKYAIIDNSNDPYEIEEAKEWILNYEEEAIIERKY